MRCPACGEQDNRVLESRDVEDGMALRRRRQCNKCSTRYTTYERVEISRLFIVKKSGERQAYSRDKLSKGIYRAFEKRPTAIEEIELLISRIEHQLLSMEQNEVDSSKLGELVMTEIKKVDPVAYVRFASVYRSFSDLSSFEKELSKMRKEQKIVE